jgi:hypothetical protein
MTDQLDFGVNWVKGFSVRRASESMDTFKILHYSTWIISSPAAVALLYHVMQFTCDFDILITENNFLS